MDILAANLLRQMRRGHLTDGVDTPHGGKSITVGGNISRWGGWGVSSGPLTPLKMLTHKLTRLLRPCNLFNCLRRLSCKFIHHTSKMLKSLASTLHTRALVADSGRFLIICIPNATRVFAYLKFT